MITSGSPGPLAGRLVVDFGMNIAGPYGASVLSDFGATVVKVEPPMGDSGRGYPPERGGVSVLFASMNHDKRYVALDLRNPGARPVVDALVEQADVLVQNLRPGAPERLGIDAERCHDINPSLVHCSVEAFYPGDGPRPGYDLMVQAESGLLSLTGDEASGPCRFPAAILDHVAGLWLALGAMAELAGPRDRAVVRLSMLDVAMALLNDKAATFVADGIVPTPMGSGTSTTAPHRAYRTASGHIVVGAANDGLFRKLVDLLDVEALRADRFATQAGRLEHRTELDDLVGAALAGADAEVWLARLDASGIPAALVRELPDAVARHRDASATGFADLAEGLSIVAPPHVGSGRVFDPPVPGPPGADTDAVLHDLLGFDEPTIARLIEEQIVA